MPKLVKVEARNRVDLKLFCIFLGVTTHAKKMP